MDRWRALMRQCHYLGFRRFVGKSFCYVATRETQWAALLGWGSAALTCAARDKWIGWDRQLQFKRLHLIANNVRFLCPIGISPTWPHTCWWRVENVISEAVKFFNLNALLPYSGQGAL